MNNLIENPIAENNDVVQFLRSIEENQVPGRDGLRELIGHVAEMESQLSQATEELKALRTELQGLKESPLKKAMHNYVKKLESNMSKLRVRLTNVKNGIIEGCKSAMASCKEHGVSALAGAVRFFHIRPTLTTLQSEINFQIKSDKATLAKIDSMSNNYHEAGRNIKNAIHTLTGKDPVLAAKENGKLAAALSAPFCIALSSHMKMQKIVEQALSKLDQLEQKTSILKTMRSKQAKEPGISTPSPSPHKERA